MQLAMEAIRSKTAPSIRKVAELFDIPPSTLQDRLAGQESSEGIRRHNQRFNVEEENSIAKAALQLHAWGWPLSLQVLHSLAIWFADQKGGSLAS